MVELRVVDLSVREPERERGRPSRPCARGGLRAPDRGLEEGEGRARLGSVEAPDTAMKSLVLRRGASSGTPRRPPPCPSRLVALAMGPAVGLAAGPRRLVERWALCAAIARRSARLRSSSSLS
mmetsp:Transcript_23142/g.72219  ORF Transcript_23142/g.72219 Transcript_23142/m.72219 type:complete len:123 (-) Transcript_23142:738-1106(-)